MPRQPYRRYSLLLLTKAYLRQWPELTYEDALQKATVLRTELHRLDVAWYRSELNYYANTISAGQTAESFYEVNYTFENFLKLLPPQRKQRPCRHRHILKGSAPSCPKIYSSTI